MRSRSKHMKQIAVAAIALTVTAPAFGQKTVPFAEPPSRQPGQIETSLLPSLGDIMVDTQLRHIKLWYAGRARNWDLANYELDRIGESLTKAGHFIHEYTDRLGCGNE
jgi:hypothetical protein